MRWRTRLSMGGSDERHRCSLHLLGCFGSDLVPMVALMERWEMADPERVLMRKQEMARQRAENIRESRQERARRELEALFEVKREGTDEAKHRNSAG